MTIEELAQEMREGFNFINERLDSIDGRLNRLENGQKYILGLAETTAGANIGIAKAVVEIQSFLAEKYGKEWTNPGFPYEHPETMKVYRDEVRKRIVRENPELANYIQNNLQANQSTP